MGDWDEGSIVIVGVYLCGDRLRLQQILEGEREKSLARPQIGPIA
jgi:hypothetical protein